MSAWYVVSAMGFYPFNPCGGEYVIGAPQLPRVTLRLADGKTFTVVANASADGWNAGAFAETGAVLTISDAYKLYAMPYFGLAYTHAATDSFKESGSDAAFDADSLAGDSLRARLGCSFSWRFDVAGARWRVGLDVAYSHELLDDEIDVDVKATDGSKISETAKALPEDVFSIGPSVNVDLTKSASIYAGYSFNAGTDSATAHNANVGFRMRF